jgi:Na+-driven multidrug efflux pump
MTKFEKLLLKESIRYHMCDQDDPPGAWDYAMEFLAYLSGSIPFRTCSTVVQKFIREARKATGGKDEGFIH